MYNLDDIGMNAWYFKDKHPCEIVKLVGASGFNVIEFTGRQLGMLTSAELAELKNGMHSSGIRVASINAACDLNAIAFGNLISEIEGERQKSLAHIKRYIDLCQYFHIPRIIVDVGTTQSENHTPERQEGLFLKTYTEIVNYINKCNLKLNLLIVPHRRKIQIYNILDIPQDEIFNQVARLKTEKIGWVFDTANVMAGRQNMNSFSLIREAEVYMKRGLDVLYLANHPGPFTRTFRRASYHNPPWDGYYTQDDYRNLFSFLNERGFDGQISLHLSVKNPCIEELKKERLHVEKLLS